MKHQALTPEQVIQFETQTGRPIDASKSFEIFLQAEETNERYYLLLNDMEIPAIYLTRSDFPFFAREIKNPEQGEDALILIFPFMDEDDEEHCTEVTQYIKDYLQENELLGPLHKWSHIPLKETEIEFLSKVLTDNLSTNTYPNNELEKLIKRLKDYTEE